MFVRRSNNDKMRGKFLEEIMFSCYYMKSKALRKNTENLYCANIIWLKESAISHYDSGMIFDNIVIFYNSGMI